MKLGKKELKFTIPKSIKIFIDFDEDIWITFLMAIAIVMILIGIFSILTVGILLLGFGIFLFILNKINEGM